jgi:hypothetical protein
MRDGNPGIYGNPGNVVSVSYRFYSPLKGSNPTLSGIQTGRPRRRGSKRFIQVWAFANVDRRSVAPERQPGSCTLRRAQRYATRRGGMGPQPVCRHPGQLSRASGPLALTLGATPRMWASAGKRALYRTTRGARRYRVGPSPVSDHGRLRGLSQFLSQSGVSG